MYVDVDQCSLPVIPAPSELEVAQMVREPVEESVGRNIMSGEIQMCTGEYLSAVCVCVCVCVEGDVPVYAGGVHGVQSHVHHLCSLGELVKCCYGHN